MRGGTECGTPPKSKAHKMEGGGGGLHSSSRLMGPVSEDGDVKRRARVRAEKAVKVGVVNEWAWRYVGVANAWVGPRKYVDVQTQWSTVQLSLLQMVATSDLFSPLVAEQEGVLGQEWLQSPEEDPQGERVGGAELQGGGGKARRHPAKEAPSGWRQEGSRREQR